jgi:predicted secreted Zn-dependent protease
MSNIAPHPARNFETTTENNRPQPQIQTGQAAINEISPKQIVPRHTI